MQWYRVNIKPTSAFSSALVANTIFGQFCWTVKFRYGEVCLNSILENYDSSPSIVFSDAFPCGFIPKPALPSTYIFKDKPDSKSRKKLKKAQWLELEEFSKPIAKWGEMAKTYDEALNYSSENNNTTQEHSAQGSEKFSVQMQHSHNTISRTLGSTSSGQFAPFSETRTWYNDKIALDIYILIDDSRIDIELVKQCIEDIGLQGFGANASSGSGKFKLQNIEKIQKLSQNSPTAFMTLAACCPQGCGINSKNSYYQPKVHFGRHGGLAVFNGNPFKSPVLAADTGAVFTLSKIKKIDYIGQKIGGDGTLSKNIPKSVFQGYAPVVGINMLLE